MQWRKFLFIKLLILLSIAPRFVGAQYSFQWVLKTAGDDGADKMIETSDGKFIVIGGSSGTNNIPAGNYIACVSQQGQMLWQKYGHKNHYGTSGGLADILETNNHHFFIGGTSSIWQYSGNAFYLNMDGNGNFLWDSAYRVTDGGGGGIREIIDDPSSQTLVSIGLGATDDNHVYWMFQKTSYRGERIMYKYITETQNKGLRGFFKNTNGDGYTVFCDSAYDPMPVYMIKLDTNGNTISKKYIGNDQINSLVQNENNTYTAIVQKAPTSIYLYTYDSSGNTVSTNLISNDEAHVTFLITNTKDKGYALLGSYLMIVDSSMAVTQENQLWTIKDSVGATMFAQASDGGFYGCGQHISNQPDIINPYDFYIFKTAPDGTLTDTITYIDIPVTGINEAMNISDKIKIYPNPATDRITIEGISANTIVTITDMVGKIVYSGVNINSADVSMFSKGVYFIQLTDERTRSSTTKKFIVN